jgi:hypothetical protein
MVVIIRVDWRHAHVSDHHLGDFHIAWRHLAVTLTGPFPGSARGLWEVVAPDTIPGIHLQLQQSLIGCVGCMWKGAQLRVVRFLRTPSCLTLSKES